MLKLENIKKTYNSGGEAVTALRGVSLEFRANEFVSILGPSGCGKTTMLNIIGGLDKYSSGDLVINGTSTKNYKDENWDAYRNNAVGFVFQGYNLISHQTLLQNVEIAMTLSGVSSAERKERATKALQEVGLGDKLNKKPNQLSGGQMQRVAIARALVNNPKIILADEPTGALDSKTSVQIMELLKEVAKTRLVIMVTHNPPLAEEYSTRIINLLDGELQSDTNPIQQNEGSKQESSGVFPKTSMSMLAAMSLSFRNLVTKKGRTVTTAIAGSIGIVGLGLVLALVGGMGDWMSSMEEEQRASFPILVPQAVQTDFVEMEDFPNHFYIPREDVDLIDFHHQTLTPAFLSHIEQMQLSIPHAIQEVSLNFPVVMPIIVQTADGYERFDTGASPSSSLDGGNTGFFNTQFSEMPSSHDFILGGYELITGRMAVEKHELMLVVNEYNGLDESFFENIGLSFENHTPTFYDFMADVRFRFGNLDEFLVQEGDVFVPINDIDNLSYIFHSQGGLELEVVGVLRVQENPIITGQLFSEGLLHTRALTEYALEIMSSSNIAQAQMASDFNIVTGEPFESEEERQSFLQALGVNDSPNLITIFATGLAEKAEITEFIAQFNVGIPLEQHIISINLADFFPTAPRDMFEILPVLLGGFAAISLVVSTIMIGLITYVSVMERTKEIGILRSVGARKKDITRVFIAETLLIGLLAGTLGVIATYILVIPVNTVFYNLAEVQGLAALSPMFAALLIAGSATLTVMAGFFPSRKAAKKDPVEALRTE